MFILVVIYFALLIGCIDGYKSVSKPNHPSRRTGTFLPYRYSYYSRLLQATTSSTAGIPKGSEWRKGDDQYNTRLLCRMISQNDMFNATREFFYSEFQIEEAIIERKIKVFRLNEESGLLPLRYSIRLGRRDIVKLLLRHGASSTAKDNEGLVINELFQSTPPGHLHMLTDLLEGISPEQSRAIMDSELQGLHKYAVQYWIRRGFSHILPRTKLNELGIPRLDSLKYRIVGQNYALEQILSEVASNYANTELARKPLVLLFAGPPGHGKSETAKQLADLLGAPFHKVDCRNHAHPWEMFGSGAGYIGSDSGSQLGNFMSSLSGKRSVVLLDEFDHCNSETWEAFYHIFEEGEYTLKKVNAGDKNGEMAATRQLDCSRTIWLLTTNRFDNDIVTFNELHQKSIAEFKRGNYAYDSLNDKFEEFIRPKLRKFFQGGLTRRINSIVPFFFFDPEEAAVVTDMYVDYLRQMYAKPPTEGRKIGNFAFDVTNYAVGELSKAYFKHQLDGASAIVREVNGRIVKRLIHMRWIRGEQAIAAEGQETWIHYGEESGGPYVIGAASEEVLAKAPYFLQANRPAVLVKPEVSASQASRFLSDELDSRGWVDPFRKVSAAVAGAALEEFQSAAVDASTSLAVSSPTEPIIDKTEWGVTDLISTEHVDAVAAATRLDSSLPVDGEVSPIVQTVVNITVTFVDGASSAVTFGSPIPTGLPLDHLKAIVCSSLSMDINATRMWVQVLDGMADMGAQRGGLGFEDGRPCTVEITDIVGDWLFIRNYNLLVEDVLLMRHRIGCIPESECLRLLLELPKSASKYATTVSYPLDIPLNAWREKLDAGDIIDVRTVEGDTLSWREGIVTRVGREYDGERSVLIRVLGSDAEEIKMRVSSPLLQPLYSMSRNWRSHLRVGDHVEIRMTQGKWHLAHVVRRSVAVDLAEETVVELTSSSEVKVFRAVNVYSDAIRLPQHSRSDGSDISKRIDREELPVDGAKSLGISQSHATEEGEYYDDDDYYDDGRPTTTS